MNAAGEYRAVAPQWIYIMIANLWRGLAVPFHPSGGSDWVSRYG